MSVTSMCVTFVCVGVVWVLHQCVSRLCVWGWYMCKFMHWVLCVPWLCVYVGVMCESGGGVCECKFMV